MLATLIPRSWRDKRGGPHRLTWRSRRIHGQGRRQLKVGVLVELAVVVLTASLFSTAAPAHAASITWQLLPGRATDIGVGANGAVWMIGNNPVPGGYGIYEFVNGAWQSRPGGAVRIAVGPDGRPWVVNSDGRIFAWTGSNWSVFTTQSARDIAVDASGELFVIGRIARAGGYNIMSWRGGPDGFWFDLGGGAVRIAAGDRVWVVNNAGRVFRYDSVGWVALPGTASDVGAARMATTGRDVTWITGTVTTPGGYTVHRFDGVEWDQFSGGAVAVSVAPDGAPWVVNSYGEIFRSNVIIDPEQCPKSRASVAERAGAASVEILKPGESVHVTPDPNFRIWPGWIGQGENGPAGVPGTAPSNHPLPGARQYSLLVSTGSGWRYLGEAATTVQNTTGAPQWLRLGINDDVPGNGSGAFAVDLTWTCRT